MNDDEWHQYPPIEGNDTGGAAVVVFTLVCAVITAVGLIAYFVF